MGALANEPFRALSKVQLDDGLGNRRSYTVSVDVVTPDTAAADQATWDGAPGRSLTLRLQWDSVGTPAFSAADTVSIKARLPGSGSDIGATWSPAISGNSGTTTTTMHLDDNPLDGAAGTNRAGIIELLLTVQRAAAVAWGPVDSRGTGTPPAATTLKWGRGYWRAQVTVSAFSISDASLGGAEPGAFYATKSTFNRTTLADAWYRGAALLLKHRQSAADVRSSDADTPTDTAVQRNYTWNASATGTGGKGRINKDYAAASTATDVRMVLPANTFGGSADLEYSLAASGHIATWTRVDASTLEKASRITVDPRITFAFLLQLNDNAWGTPPGSKNVATGQRLSADLGFIGSRAKDMNGAGLNGVAWTDKLWDAAGLVGTEGSPVKSHATTGTTQGGEAGWGETATLPITWDNSLPGGAWTQKEVITTADLVGLETANTRSLTLLSADPRIGLTIGFGDPTTPKDHWYPGKALIVGVAVTKNGVLSLPDSIEVVLARFNPATGSVEYLDPSDVNVNTWTNLPAGGTPGFFTSSTTPAVAPSAGNADLFLLQFTGAQTGQSNWNYQGTFVLARATIAGVPYTKTAAFSSAGAKNKHSVNAFDPTGLFA